MRTLYAGSVAKFAERPEDNEDRFIVGDDGRHLTVCDGASESFDAARWAELVSAWFHAEPFSAEGLRRVVANYDAERDPTTLSWSKQMAFERGSFSTLCRVEAGHDNALHVTCVGDSLMVLTDATVLLHTQPYATSARFDERPLLLSTLPAHNGAFDDAPFVDSLTERVEVPVDAPCFVLLMTDALGRWLLSRLEAGETTALTDLVSIRSDAELAALVESARADGSMQRDDSTLVVATAWDAP